MTTVVTARDRLYYALACLILFPVTLAEYLVKEQPLVVIAVFWIAVAAAITLAWRWL